MDGQRPTAAPRLGVASDRGRRDASHSIASRGRRFAELAGIARRNGLLPWRRLDFTTDPATSELRMRQADGLRRALEEAGGAFVKLGQLLSTRNDFMPVEWVTALSALQRDVAPAEWAEVERMLETEFGAPLRDVFARFDEQPLAAASIGQVHRARLKSGEEVAVKVLRPGIIPEVRRDVDIALRFARTLVRSSPRARRMGMQQIAEQYGADLLRQLDFRLEALNLTAMTALHERGPRADEVRLPAIHQSLSTDVILVMDYLPGDTITTITARGGARSDELEHGLRAVMRSFLRQIVFDGAYHSDLHPGNILMMPDGVPALVDFGSVGRLDLEIRQIVQDLLIAYLQGDNRLIADGLLTLAELRPDADEAAFRRELSGFLTLELGPGARVDVRTVDALVVILTRYGMSVPAEFVAAARGFAILEGTLRTAVPDLDLLDEARSLASELIRDQMAPRTMMSAMSLEMLGFVPLLRKLPRRVDRISGSLENGSLSLNIRVLADRRDRRLLSGFVRQILLTGVGTVSALTAVGYLTTPDPAADAALSPTTAGVVLGIGSIIAFVAAATDVLIGRFRR